MSPSFPCRFSKLEYAHNKLLFYKVTVDVGLLIVRSIPLNTSATSFCLKGDREYFQDAVIDRIYTTTPEPSEKSTYGLWESTFIEITIYSCKF